MWSEFSPVKVVAWRMQHFLKTAGWLNELLDKLFLEESDLAFAQFLSEQLEEGEIIINRDYNCVI